MPRGGVEIWSCFGGDGAPSKPMAIRILQSRRQPGHVNILMNPKHDDNWINVVEAYDVDARDLLMALKLAGVVKSYQLPPKRKHQLTLFGYTLVGGGKMKPSRSGNLAAILDDRTRRRDRYYSYSSKSLPRDAAR